MIKQKEPPYQNTDVDPIRTKYQLEALLKEYGAEAVRWTENYQRAEIVLEFIFTVEVEGVRRQLGFRIKPPILTAKKRQNTQYGKQLVEVPQYGQSMRLLYWYVKAKLEAAAYGLDSLEHVFMSEIIHKLPGGEETTIGETMTHVLAEGAENRLALPRKDEAKIIEAQGEAQT